MNVVILDDSSSATPSMLRTPSGPRCGRPTRSSQDADPGPARAVVDRPAIRWWADRRARRLEPAQDDTGRLRQATRSIEPDGDVRHPLRHAAVVDRIGRQFGDEAPRASRGIDGGAARELLRPAGTIRRSWRPGSSSARPTGHARWSASRERGGVAATARANRGDQTTGLEDQRIRGRIRDVVADRGAATRSVARPANADGRRAGERIQRHTERHGRAGQPGRPGNRAPSRPMSGRQVDEDGPIADPRARAPVRPTGRAGRRRPGRVRTRR